MHSRVIDDSTHPARFKGASQSVNPRGEWTELDYIKLKQDID